MSAATNQASDKRVFSARAVLWMVLAGVFSFSAFIVLSAYAPDLDSGSDGGSHALSRSAVGFAGLVRLLRADGVPVVVSREPASQGTSTGVYILTPDVSVSAKDLQDLSAWGPALVILPKWEAAPQPLRPDWVNKVGVIDADKIAKMLQPRFGTIQLARRPSPSTVRLASAYDQLPASGPIDQLQTISAPTMQTVLTDELGHVVLARTSDARAYILSDPDLLNTHGLGDLATARAGLAVLAQVRTNGGPVVFDVTLNGFKRSRSLLKLAFEPPFLGATLCLVGAALLMALHAASRFGAPRLAPRAFALGKQVLADNSAALIRLARREPRMAGRYLDQTRAAVAKALGATRVGEAELDDFLDRVGARSGVSHRLSALRVEAGAIKDRDGLLRLALNLHDWRAEMTRERT